MMASARMTEEAMKVNKDKAKILSAQIVAVKEEVSNRSPKAQEEANKQSTTNTLKTPNTAVIKYLSRYR
mgnify:CR=1 FL=1